MKTIVVLYSGGRHWGGIESYLANLFRLYDPEKMKLILISLGRWELTEVIATQAPCSEISLLSGRRIRPQTVADLRRVTRARQASLIVSQGNVANAYARAASLVTGVPNLTVVHSDMALDYPRVVARWVYTVIDRLLRPHTKQYVAVSRYLKDQVVASGVEAESVRVVYNGVDTVVRGSLVPGHAQRLPGNDAGGQGVSPVARTEHESEVSLASVGRLHTVKNFDALVAAMRLLPERVRLTIWGEGSERASLEALVERLGLSARVGLPGESENMQRALEGVNIYVQPSKSEGCSFAVAEAMLNGTPVVVTPRGGLPEQVEDGVTGLVARDCTPQGLADAVDSLVRDADLAARLGQAGRRAAEEMYDMGKWLRETTTAFCEAALEVDRSR
jgi:glycosyltransferase involved in cell wall biosynthesis